MDDIRFPKKIVAPSTPPKNTVDIRNTHIRNIPSNSFPFPNGNSDQHVDSSESTSYPISTDLPPKEPSSQTEIASPMHPLTKEPPLNKKKRKKRLILISAICTLFVGAGALYWFVFRADDSQQENVTLPVEIQEEEPAPPPPVSPLTGKELKTEALAKRPVTGIMIENSPEARPQSGLLQADMVIEAIAEGGVTRFLALYQESQPDYIGPIRSARPYYVDYALGYDASYGHVGGSPEALSDIKSLGVKDIDQFYNASAYYRISSRYAPHNMYSDFTKLNTLNKQKGYLSSTFTPLERKADVAQTPTASSITFALSGPRYNPTFTYNKAGNSYMRSQAGAAHIDLRSGKQINPKVVIALVLKKGYDPDGYHTDYTTSGTGKAYVFQDGIVSVGTWTKKDRKASLQLSDENGLSMSLNAGQTWITFVSGASDVRYSAP